MSKQVGIILVNYRDYAERFLIACRNALRQQTYPIEFTKIYIVDNAATNQSAEFLKSNYPEATILCRSDGNYAAANNLGFQQAIDDGCHYLVTLNMDTVVQVDWLIELVRALEENPLAVIAQSKIWLYPQAQAEEQCPKINSLGNVFHFLGFGFTSHYGQDDFLTTGYPEITGYASGCSFIIRASAWQKVGGYNEEFYMYHDDVELSLKVKLTGGKIILAPKSLVYHKYEFSRSTRLFYYMERNRWLTIFIFYPIRLLFLLTIPLVLMQLALFIYSLISGRFKTLLLVKYYFLKPTTYAKIYKQRQYLKKISLVKFSDLARNFGARIEFQEIANPLLKYMANPIMDLYWRLIKKII